MRIFKKPQMKLSVKNFWESSNPKITNNYLKTMAMKVSLRIYQVVSKVKISSFYVEQSKELS